LAAARAYIAAQDYKIPSPDVDEVLAVINSTKGMKIPGKDYKKKIKGPETYDIYYNPPVYGGYTEGENKNPIPQEDKSEFQNQYPNELADELDQAKRLGVEPTSPRNSEVFDKMIDEGPIKWVVTKDGKFKVMEKEKFGEELSHPVLSNGKEVLAAGEATIAGNATDGYFVLEFNNHSCHFNPSNNSLELGKTKLKSLINVLNNF
jgi:hypothetical protein